MVDNVIVTFTKPWRGYSPGEVAGFAAEMAGSLIGGGVATAYAAESGVVSVPLGGGRKGGGKGSAKKAETGPPVPVTSTGEGLEGTVPTSEPDGAEAGGGGGTDGPPDDLDDEKP